MSSATPSMNHRGMSCSGLQAFASRPAATTFWMVNWWASSWRITCSKRWRSPQYGSAIVKSCVLVTPSTVSEMKKAVVDSNSKCEL